MCECSPDIRQALAQECGSSAAVCRKHEFGEASIDHGHACCQHGRQRPLDALLHLGLALPAREDIGEGRLPGQNLLEATHGE